MTPSARIARRFADVPHGQIHFRTAGDGAPLLVLHASPGSSKQQVALIEDLADLGHVIAPDTPGNGDSDALPLDAPAITDLAQALLGFLDAIGVDRVRLYGSHTGAAIATELAIAAPERVERLVLDGVQVLTDAERAEVLAQYAHPFTPDLDGAYLIRAFQFCRDQYLFYPWYDRTAAGQRIGGLPHPRALRDWVVEVLKASESYHLNYRAAFQWRAPDRLPLAACPTLLLAAVNDPLVEQTGALLSILRNGQYKELPRFDAPDYRSVRKSAITAFLNG